MKPCGCDCGAWPELMVLFERDEEQEYAAGLIPPHSRRALELMVGERRGEGMFCGTDGSFPEG